MKKTDSQRLNWLIDNHVMLLIQQLPDKSWGFHLRTFRGPDIMARSNSKRHGVDMLIDEQNDRKKEYAKKDKETQ